MARERDDDLALFHEMQKRERERKHSVRKTSMVRSAGENVDTHLAARLASSSLYRMATSGASYRTRTSDDLLTSDLGKNDYDWLLTPPGTPLVTSSDQDPGANSRYVPQRNLSLAPSLAALKTSSRLSNAGAPAEAVSSKLHASRADLPTKTGAASSMMGVTNVLSRPAGSSSGVLSTSTNGASRRSSLTPISAPSSRASSRPTSRATTPTSRPTISSSSTSTRTTIVTSTISSSSANSRTTIVTSSTKSGTLSHNNRSSTPSKRPTTPILAHQTQSQPVVATSRSSSVSKASSLPSRSTASSRGSSPTARPRLWQPSEMPGFSLEPPPNLRTTMPERSTSNTRGSSLTRPGSGTLTRSTQVENISDMNRSSRRQSCSPSVTRGRLQTSDRPSSINTMQTRINGKGVGTSSGEASGHIVIGSKMVEKVMQARRAAASSAANEELRQEHASNAQQAKRTMKPTTPTFKDTSGLAGRNSSKKASDILGLNHMDFRQSASNGFRSINSNVSASSFHSARSVSGRGNGFISRVADSPMGTSSNASSDHHMSNSMRDMEGSEIGDEEVYSEAGSKALYLSQPDSLYALSKNVTVNNWLGSPDYREDSVELMQLFRQGIEKFAGSESPLVCQHGFASNCDRCGKAVR